MGEVESVGSKLDSLKDIIDQFSDKGLRGAQSSALTNDFVSARDRYEALREKLTDVRGNIEIASNSESEFKVGFLFNHSRKCFKIHFISL